MSFLHHSQGYKANRWAPTHLKVRISRKNYLLLQPRWKLWQQCLQWRLGRPTVRKKHIYGFQPFFACKKENYIFKQFLDPLCKKLLQESIISQSCSFSFESNFTFKDKQNAASKRKGQQCKLTILVNNNPKKIANTRALTSGISRIGAWYLCKTISPGPKTSTSNGVISPAKYRVLPNVSAQLNFSLPLTAMSNFKTNQQVQYTASEKIESQRWIKCTDLHVLSK